MIFVECKPDETLVKVLLPRRQVIHARSKPRVVYQVSRKKNCIVVLRPRLEEWVLGAARLERVDVADYNLPADASSLREVINHRLSNLKRLVNALRGSVPMAALRRALTP